MKTEKYSLEVINQFMRKKKVCTLDELMQRMGTFVRKTIFRKLSKIEYQTSYSHHGKYYALRSCCKFDLKGLWNFDKARFSVYETLLETARQLVENSNGGYTADELNQVLHVSTKHALLTLHARDRLIRQKIGRSKGRTSTKTDISPRIRTGSI